MVMPVPVIMLMVMGRQRRFAGVGLVRMRMTVIVGVTMIVAMIMTVTRCMRGVSRLVLLGMVCVLVPGVMGVQMHVELHPRDIGLGLPSDVQVISGEVQLLQFPLQHCGRDAQIDQRRHEHVPADAAENIKV